MKVRNFQIAIILCRVFSRISNIGVNQPLRSGADPAIGAPGGRLPLELGYLVTTSAAKPLEALAGTRGTDSWLDSTDIDNKFGADLLFTARAYARAVLGVIILSVCLSVCLFARLSVTRMDCDKSKWCSADILIPHERAITLLL